MQNPTPELENYRLNKFKNIPYNLAPNPSFIIDKDLLEENLILLNSIYKETGAKILLAQKAYSCFSTYPLIANYLNGTSSSGLFEAKLAKDFFGKEIHVYSPAYNLEEIKELSKFCHKIIFNSIQQLSLAVGLTENIKKPEFGLRVNPGYSSVSTSLYNPCSPSSRLGSIRSDLDKQLLIHQHNILDNISGLHFHALCEEDSYALKETALAFEENFKDLLPKINWVNFGGGHHITRPNYNLDILKEVIIYFKEKYNLQIYLEPGEAVCLHTGILNAKVLDIFKTKEGTHAIINISATCHTPDVLEMPYRAQILESGLPKEKRYNYIIGGISCLAGDSFGEYSFDKALEINQTIQFLDMAHYTMVKTTNFNGVPLPSICLYNEKKGLEVIKNFGYKDYLNRLS